MTRTHLITGVAGQDGVLLARLLRSRGDHVVGTVLPGADTGLHVYLDDVDLVEHDVRDQDGFAALLASRRPAAVHNLAAMSSVADSWDDPSTTREVNQVAVEQMLAVLADRFPDVAFVQASSTEIFGAAGGPGTSVGATTALDPVSPYGESKAAAHEAVAAARARGLRASNLILFGHTSSVQSDRFVLPGIARQAAEVARGVRERVELQNPQVRRDWGSAPDFVRAFVAATTAAPTDAVIGTGELHSLEDVVAWALAAAGAPVQPAARAGAERARDFDGLVADTAPAAERLGWRAGRTLREEIAWMVTVAGRRTDTGVDQDPAYLGGAG